MEVPRTSPIGPSLTPVGESLPREPAPCRRPAAFFAVGRGPHVVAHSAVTSADMRRIPTGRVTIRNALILGFGLTLRLWLFVGYEFVNRVSEVERRSAGIASRYIFAQDLVSSLRNSLLGTSALFGRLAGP